MVLGDGGVAGGKRGGADFAMEFTFVGVAEEVCEQEVCRLDGADGVSGEDGREAFLPVVVTAFDFAFRLRSWSEAEGDAVEPERLAELGKSIRRMSEKERVVIDVEGQRQAVEEENGGEKIEMGSERFGGVKASASVEAGGVVEDVEEHLFLRAIREEGVRSRIVLPEGTEIADLPATDRFCGLFKTGIRSEVVSDGPAADRSTVGLEIKAARQLAGDSAVGGRRRGTQQASGQSEDIRWPWGAMVATRRTRLPKVRATIGTSAEIIGAKLVNAGFTHAQLRSDIRRGQLARAEAFKQMADERR